MDLVCRRMSVCLQKEYSAWFDSPPFDIGTTTTKVGTHRWVWMPAHTGRSDLWARDDVRSVAMASMMQALEVAFSGLAKVVRKAARDHNQQSQSNGCLMRCTPLAVSEWATDRQGCSHGRAAWPTLLAHINFSLGVCVCMRHPSIRHQLWGHKLSDAQLMDIVAQVCCVPLCEPGYSWMESLDRLSVLSVCAGGQPDAPKQRRPECSGHIRRRCW